MRHTFAAALCCAAPLFASPALAQHDVTLRTEALFYGDDTEFHNEFRDGETLFGVAARGAVEASLSERVTIAAGIAVNQRFGSDDAFEQVRPVISLTVRGQRSTFVVGTLPFSSIDNPVGPDNDGPHRLVPPLQRESLSYERPYEAGLAWSFAGSRLDHHFWLAWQRLNTVQHRERFDGGVRTSVSVNNTVSIPLQLHVVHEGGQQYAAGPVRDSSAAAAGVRVNGLVAGAYRSTVEVLALGSRHVPDRATPDRTRDGVAFFGRASAERGGWRGHVIFWRGRNFIKEEGDANYLSVNMQGESYRGTRDYSEAGLTRRFTLAPSAVLDVAGRLHRVEGRYEYSFRILSAVSALWKLR
jgi:hypothetical protein